MVTWPKNFLNYSNKKYNYIQQGYEPSANDLPDIFVGVIPYLVSTRCGPCSESQKKDGAKVLKAVIERHPEEWRRIMSKFDPDGKYAKQHGDFWRSKGVNI